MRNLYNHAERELRKAGLFDDDSDYGGAIGDAVLALVSVFEAQGHSGYSGSMTIDLLSRLLRFENLMPLTSDPDEWIYHEAEVYGVEDGLWQNARRPSAFSHDGGKTYYLVDDPDTIFVTQS